MREYRSSISTLVCCFALVLGLLMADVGQAVTYTLFGASQQQWNGNALRRNLPGSGTLTGPAGQTGSLMVPGNRFAISGTAFQFFPGAPGFAQNVSTFTEAQTAAHTLAASGGPGNFEFCPPIGNPLNPACNQAAGVAGYAGFIGFLDYDPGPNQFGGTFRVARKVQTVTSARIATGPSQFAHQKEIRGALPAQAGGPTTFRSAYFVPTPSAPSTTPLRRDWAAGLPYRSQYFQASAGVVTISPVLAPGEGWIQTAGPAGTATPIAPGPSTSTGFAFTTGRARQVAVNTLGAIAAFTVTGGNYRGPDGQGNIVLVAGGLFQSRFGISSTNYAIMKLGLVDTTVPEPTTGWGLATGVATLLALLIGARRRRS